MDKANADLPALLAAMENELADLPEAHHWRDARRPGAAGRDLLRATTGAHRGEITAALTPGADRLARTAFSALNADRMVESDSPRPCNAGQWWRAACSTADAHRLLRRASTRARMAGSIHQSAAIWHISIFRDQRPS